jgi:hypothetical protein
MHWYTWALVLWATFSGVPALAVLFLLLPRAVAGRVSTFVTTRRAASPFRPVALTEPMKQDAA